MASYGKYKAETLDRNQDLIGLMKWMNVSIIKASQEWLDLAENRAAEFLEIHIEYPNENPNDEEKGNWRLTTSQGEWEDYGDIIDLSDWFDVAIPQDPDSDLIYGELKEWYKTVLDAFGWPQSQLEKIDVDDDSPLNSAKKLQAITTAYKDRYIPVLHKEYDKIAKLAQEASMSEKALNDTEDYEMMEETTKTVAEDIAERIIETSVQAVRSLNQATATNSTNIIKQYLMEIKSLEEEAADDSGMLDEDIVALATQADDVADISLRRFHTDIRSWDAYAVQREDAKLTFSKMANYWGKVLSAYQSPAPSRRKSASLKFGVPNYRYKIGEMVKVGNRFGKVVGISKEGGTGKQVYDVRIEGKDNVRKCGLKELSSATSKKKVKSGSVKSGNTTDEAYQLVSEYAKAIQEYLPEVKKYVAEAKSHFKRMGASNLTQGVTALAVAGDVFIPISNDLQWGGGTDKSSYLTKLLQACEQLDIPTEALAGFVNTWSMIGKAVQDAGGFEADIIYSFDEQDREWNIATWDDPKEILKTVDRAIEMSEQWLGRFDKSIGTKSIKRSIKSEMTPEKAKAILDTYADCIDIYSDMVLSDVEDVKKLLASKGMNNILKASELLGTSSNYWWETIMPDMFKGSGADSNHKYLEVLHQACETLDKTNGTQLDTNEMSWFMDTSNPYHDANDFIDFFIDDFTAPKGSKEWSEAIYIDENETLADLENHMAVARKWMNTYRSSKKSIRSQIKPFKAEFKMGSYTSESNLPDTYIVVDEPSEVWNTLGRIGVEPEDFDFIILEDDNANGEVWGGEGEYRAGIRVQRLQ